MIDQDEEMTLKKNDFMNFKSYQIKTVVKKSKFFQTGSQSGRSLKKFP